jgi:two-component system, NtrC family, sensor kinase
MQTRGFRPAARRGIAGRLTFSFVLLFAILGLAAYFGRASLFELHDALHEVEHAARRQGTVLQLASAIRDQYAHMAHTLILGNDTHSGYYRQASALVLETARKAEGAAQSTEEQGLVKDVRAQSRRLDHIFESALLPAVERGDRQAAVAIHHDVLDIVARAQKDAQSLSDLSAQAIADVGLHAEIVEHKAIQSTLLFLGLALAFVVVVALYLYRSLTVPIRHLARGTAELAAGNLAVRLPVIGRDELADLAERFNGMTAALKEHQERLLRSERLAAVGRLAAGFAHEINNPLGVIVGYTKLLLRRGDASVTKDLTIVEQEAERCRQVVEDLLDLSRPGILERESVDLRELVDDVVARQLAACSGRAPEVAVRGQARVLGSSRKLRQVLQNLVKNALEATADGSGTVQIRIEDGRTRVALSVTDNGPGIDAEHRPKVFEPFFTTKPRGTGLGLAVSQAIARAHGGDLELVESSEERGAAFRLTLPGEETTK